MLSIFRFKFKDFGEKPEKGVDFIYFVLNFLSVDYIIRFSNFL